MAQNATKLEIDACVEENWQISDWDSTHKVIAAAGVSCYIEVGNPKIGLRFFLCPKEKLISFIQESYPILNKWYCLCAEVLSQVNENVAVKVTASLYAGTTSLYIRGIDGVIPLCKSKGKVVKVIDPLIYFESSTMTVNGELGAPTGKNLLKERGYGYIQNYSGYNTRDITITIKAELFRSTQNDKKVNPLDPVVEEIAKAEESLIYDLKKLFMAHENYADIKLESKDHMTLDAHKFLLAARSRYLKKCIDDAMKVENFNGTMKININGKSLVAILHYMYTGELHENSANVMEELVDAAILFELTHLMKLLDKQLVTICNKENMFRLYQVAQKNGMPNAMDDISVYIREHV